MKNSNKYILMLLTIVLSNCSVVSYSPELDKNLTEDGFKYLSERNLEVETENQKNYRFSDWYKYKNIDNAIGDIKIIETEQQNYIEGMHCFEPMLFVITLGIIPTHCKGRFDLVISIEESGEKRTITKKFKRTQMGGWFPMLLLPSKHWGYDFNENPYERAFITLINEESKKQ